MELAMDLRSMVLPAFGGETIKPRCPRPMGATRLMIRPEMFAGPVSRSNIFCGHCSRRVRGREQDREAPARFLFLTQLCSRCVGRNTFVRKTPILLSAMNQDSKV